MDDIIYMIGLFGSRFFEYGIVIVPIGWLIGWALRLFLERVLPPPQ